MLLSATEACTSTPQLPFKTPKLPSNRDHKALDRATLGVQVGADLSLTILRIPNHQCLQNEPSAHSLATDPILEQSVNAYCNCTFVLPLVGPYI